MDVALCLGAGAEDDEPLRLRWRKLLHRDGRDRGRPVTVSAVPSIISTGVIVAASNST